MPQGGRLRLPASALRPVVRAQQLAGFVSYALQRFLTDGCPRLAAGLSYVALLAVVPVFAIGLAVLAGFPAFEPWRIELQSFVLQNFLPDAGLEISDQLTQFVENASRMTAPGLLGLGVTVILLLATINEVLNTVWRVAEPRPMAVRLAVYWALLTLGPLLIGASLSISSYAFAAVQWFDVAAAGGWLGATRVVSILLAALGFALLYFLVPNRAVRPGHALLGGLVAAILFESLKAAFGLYLRFFPTYQLVYGAVSSIPIFLVWMYLSWIVILFGAEVAAALPEWRATRARGAAVAGPGARLALALSLLARLKEASRSGVRIRDGRLGDRLPATPSEVDETMHRLRKAGLTARTTGGGWVLIRDLETVTLGELSELLDLELSPGQGWDRAAEAAVQDLADAGHAQGSRSVAAVLDGRDRSES